MQPDDTIEVCTVTREDLERALRGAQIEVDNHDAGSFDSIMTSEAPSREDSIAKRDAAKRALDRFELLERVENARDVLRGYRDGSLDTIAESYGLAADAEAEAAEALAVAEKALADFDAALAG